MPIIYAIIARNSTVLAEFSVVAGNAGTVSRRILEKLPEHSAVSSSLSSSSTPIAFDVDAVSRVSYTQDNHVFHVLQASQGLVFLCVADAQFGRRIPFAFLDDIHLRFITTYGRLVYTALAYTMNDEFSRVLAQQMEYYSTNPNSDVISRVRNELNEVRAVMVENIDKVLERGERIELLVDKTNVLGDNTFRFKKQARILQRAIWWKNVQLIVVVGSVVSFALYLLAAFICGGFGLGNCY